MLSKNLVVIIIFVGDVFFLCGNWADGIDAFSFAPILTIEERTRSVRVHVAN